MPLCIPRGLSDAQQCTVECNSDSSFTYLLAAGAFIAGSQAEANAIAFSYACNQANLLRLCMEAMTTAVVCVGDEFDETVNITGTERNLLFEVASGTLPPGIEVIGGTMSFQLFGIPTDAGAYTFTIRATDDDGSYVEKEYALTVLQILDGSLPDFTIGIPYAHTFTATGGNGNYIWSVVSGVLPSGLVLSAGGTISGTPNLSATDQVFSVKVVDLDIQNATAEGCQRTYGLFEA